MCSDGPHLREALEEEYQGQQLTNTNMSSFPAARKHFLEGLEASLDRRFLNTQEGVILSSRIVKLDTWPEAQDSEGALRRHSVFVGSFYFRFSVTCFGCGVSIVCCVHV